MSWGCYHEELSKISACVSGIIPRMLFQGRPEEAELLGKIYQDIFGDDFYSEIQDHGLSGRWLLNTVKMGHDLALR